MFSVIPANRPCLTDFLTISPTQFAFSFPSNPPFSHLVVFILPRTSLPPNTAAGVHIQLPGSPEFKFLGAIGNEKPSAIFRVNLAGSTPAAAAASAGADGDIDAMTDEGTVSAGLSATPLPLLSAPSPHSDLGNVNIGISIEPVASIQAQLAALPGSHAPNSSAVASPSAMIVHHAPPPTKLLAQRIIKDAFNFLASFAGGGAQGQEVVPLKSFQDWWAKFERRVENDPGFLERESD